METSRLIHKPFTINDLDDLVQLRSDPDVVRYLGGEIAMTRDWNKTRLEFYIGCYQQGIGQHMMYWRETGQLIGWSGLQPLEGGAEIEVSYGLIKNFWNRGIGFETAHMWMKFGFEEQNLERIVAVADGDNTASWRIMEKLGMKFEKKEEHYSMDCVVYGITREEWESNK
ncbi:MAG: GNAT family N-acetyltransferase [Acidobacteriota bacterium]|nr:GNAT family N-acetyltransferase [Acidobacteriota bacterium]MDH3529303.1 GNAT family N-acetyltransferase [Acidobacteriota bacterium]